MTISLHKATGACR